MRTLILATTALVLITSAAAAQERPVTGPGSAIGSVFDAIGLRKPPPTPPDFVRDSRPAPDQLDYEPLKPKAETAADSKKSTESLSAAGSQLERAAAEARRRASRINVPN